MLYQILFGLLSIFDLWLSDGRLMSEILDLSDFTPKSISAQATIEYAAPNPSVSSLLDTSSDNYMVKSLPGLADHLFTTSHWAGHIPIPYADHDHYGDSFYWLLEPNLSVNSSFTVDTAPLIIWLNGGPGCSSLEGLFIENGPFRVETEVDTINIHDFSWHQLGWTVFIDQPLGTGLSRINKKECSWCDYVHNQTAVNSHIYSTLQSLYRIHPQLQDRAVYFTGESYAGHYIPAMADYIMEVNKNAKVRGDHIINIQGLAIGNGWTDPEVQYNFGEFAHNMGLISFQEQDALEDQYYACLKQEEKGDFSGLKACNIMNSILASSGVCPSRETAADDDFDDKTGKSKNPNTGACYGPIVNYYDIRDYYMDPGVDWPENSARTEQYLSRVDVQDAVHVNRALYPTIDFKECNHAGHNLMKMDGMGVVHEVIRVLDVHKIPMLFYNGQFDLICNHLGTETLLNNLLWSGQDDFINADGGIWAIPNHKNQLVPAGYSRATSDGLLTFLTVIGGSHMVPIDVPEAALDMIDRFIRQDTFFDGKQPYPSKDKKGHWSKTTTVQSTSQGHDQYIPSIVYMIVSIALIICLVMTVLSVMRSHTRRSDKYHPIRSIHHVDGEDFTIHRTVELMAVDGSRQHESEADSGIVRPYQQQHHPRYRAIVP